MTAFSSSKLDRLAKNRIFSPVRHVPFRKRLWGHEGGPGRSPAREKTCPCKIRNRDLAGPPSPGKLAGKRPDQTVIAGPGRSGRHEGKSPAFGHRRPLFIAGAVDVSGRRLSAVPSCPAFRSFVSSRNDRLTRKSAVEKRRFPPKTSSRQDGGKCRTWIEAAKQRDTTRNPPCPRFDGHSDLSGPGLSIVRLSAGSQLLQDRNNCRCSSFLLPRAASRGRMEYLYSATDGRRGA